MPDLVHWSLVGYLISNTLDMFLKTTKKKKKKKKKSAVGRVLLILKSSGSIFGRH